jgi:hypothetical protein
MGKRAARGTAPLTTNGLSEQQQARRVLGGWPPERHPCLQDPYAATASSSLTDDYFLAKPGKFDLSTDGAVS